MNLLDFKRENYITVFLCFLIGIFLYFTSLSLNYNSGSYEHFQYFAQAITQGRITLDSIPDNTKVDWVLYNSKIYFHVFPGALVIFLPSYLISQYTILDLPSGYIMLLLTCTNLYLAYKVASKFLATKHEAVLVGFGLIFASPYIYITIAPWTWYYSQAFSLTLGLLVLLLWVHSPKRFWLMGILIGLGFLTRPLSAALILYFLVVISKSKDQFANRIKLFIPLFLSVVLYALYGYIRFQRVTSGFELVNIGLTHDPQVLSYLSLGLFHPYYYIENFYYYFLAGFMGLFSGPTFSSLVLNRSISPGVSFFIIAPLFFRTFLVDLRNRNTVLLGLLTLFCFLMLPFYYYSGWPQLGPRYLIDFYPLVYLLLLRSFRAYAFGKITVAVIILSSIFNLYLLFF